AGLAGRPTRGKVVGFAAAWGALSLLAGVLDERAGRWAGGRDGGGWAP
ncbi:MAG: hypothetical protein JWQ26_329, partial [Modestobacter sp.]|nr:hypothetical protein [Modestobacter sp.]